MANREAKPTQATPGPASLMNDKQLELAALADAISAMERQLAAAGSTLTLDALRRIRPVALAAPQMREALARVLVVPPGFPLPPDILIQARAALRAANGEES